MIVPPGRAPSHAPPRPRLRLRTLLIAVAVLGVALGLGLGAWRMRERRAYCLARVRVLEWEAKAATYAADYHRMQVDICRRNLHEPRLASDAATAIDDAVFLAKNVAWEAWSQQMVDYYEARAESKSRLGADYRHVARFPWLPLPPEPPPAE